jgi:hypothetical protein
MFFEWWLWCALKEDVGDYDLKELFKESSKINELFLGDNCDMCSRGMLKPRT